MVESSWAGFLPEIFVNRLPLLKPLMPLLVSSSLHEARKYNLGASRKLAQSRMKRANDRDDFFAHLLSDKNRTEDISEDWLVSQAQVLVVAGSDTTSSFMSGVTYYLLKNPDKLRLLTQEVRGHFASGADINGDSTASLQYLSAVIEEGLRIFPPAPFGFPRTSPGMMVDGQYVPEGVGIHSL